MPDKPLSPSQAKLLDSFEWQYIQSHRTRYGLTAESLASIAPQVGKLLRKWERQLPEAHQLPDDLRDLRDLVLAGRTFQRTRGQLRMFDREAIGQLMHTLVEGQGLSKTAAAMKISAHDDKRMSCNPSSAMKWYRAWRKKHASGL